MEAARNYRTKSYDSMHEIAWKRLWGWIRLMHWDLKIRTMSSTPQTAAGGNKTEGSNTIMSTSFALKFWFNNVIDVDIILSIALTVS